MGNKSSKKSSERQVSSKQENQVDYESPVKNQTENNFDVSSNERPYTPFKNYNDDIDAKSQSLPPRCESPMKRAQHVIQKHGFFGTIKRKMQNPPSLFRRLSRRTPNSAKPTVSQTKLGIPDQNLKTKLQSNSAQSTPIKPSNRSLGEQIQALSYLDVSREIVLDSDKFNETIDDYTLRAVESTNEELLNNEIESGQDIMQNSINLEILNIARDIVENTFIGAFSEMQRLVDTDEIDNELRTCLINEAAKNLILSKSNASLSEDQYSGQLSSRNNTPAKIRKLSENQQIFSAQSPLVKQLENEELECPDSDVESPNEPKIFEHEAKATESREFLAKTSETVETGETVKTFETIETIETAEPVETIKPVETNDTTRTASETVIFQNSFVYTETSAESIPTTNQKKSTVQSIITPAVKPENVNMHDISEWSLDESRELIPRPSVRDDLSRTTLEARKDDKRETIKENLEVYKLLHEQAIAKEQIYHEIMSFNDKFENRYGEDKFEESEKFEKSEKSGKSTTIQQTFPPISLKRSEFQEIRTGETNEQLEHDFNQTLNDSEENLELVAETSNETILAPLTTIETYLPNLLSSDSIAFTMDESNGGLPDYIHESDDLARKSSSISNVSVSKTSQESNASDQTIGRTMNRTADMKSISMAKERAAMDDTRVILSQTTQNESSKRSKSKGVSGKGVSGKAGNLATGIEKPSEISKNTTSQPPAETTTLLPPNMNNSKLSTPKVNCKIEDLDDSQIYETPIGGNKMETSFSNISETTSRCETPTMKASGNSLSGSPSKDKKKRQNRKRNKGKGGASKVKVWKWMESLKKF